MDYTCVMLKALFLCLLPVTRKRGKTATTEPYELCSCTCIHMHKVIRSANKDDCD